MPTLITYLARIKTGCTSFTWTAIRAENESGAKKLLEMMYGEGKVADVDFVIDSEVSYD